MSTNQTARDAHQDVSTAPPSQDERVAERRAFMVRFGARCREARGKREIVEVAAQLGVHRNTISNIEKGSSLPDVFELERLAKLYDTTAAALLDDAAATSPATGIISKSTAAIEIDDFIYVPLFDVKVSAGDGQQLFSDVDQVLEMRPFPHSYVRRDLGIWHNEIALVTVVGTSMEPELHSKDVALLDRRDREVLSEGIHAIRLDSALLVKNLQRLPNKKLRVISANAAYKPYEIGGPEDEPVDFEVLGRVRGGLVIFH